MAAMEVGAVVSGNGKAMLLFVLVGCLALAGRTAAQESVYGYDTYNYGEYDNDDWYGEMYGTYYDDYDWEDATKDFLEISEPDCSKLPNGKMLMNGTQACDVRVSGLDASADKLPGGLDGLYVLVDCHLGHPIYRRQSSPMGEGRLLYYNIYYQDWNFIKDIGTMPTGEEMELAYGGSGYGEERPQIVDPTWWYLNMNVTSAEGEFPDSPFIEAPPVKIMCDNDMGENVEFDGKPGPSKHLPMSEPGSDILDLPSLDADSSSLSIPHQVETTPPVTRSSAEPRSGWLGYAMGGLVGFGLAGAAFFGFRYTQQNRSGGLAARMANGTLGRYPQAAMDMDTMAGAGAGGYMPPSDEDTALLNQDPSTESLGEEGSDLEQQA